MLSAILKTLLGPRWTTRARSLLAGQSLPRWGNLRRTRPFSETYGFDRGTPIDRHYLRQFLTKHRRYITGRVLEIQETSTTKTYGHDLTATDSIDINPGFGATYTCDWAEADRLVPPASYDCVLLPNTLHHLRDIDRSLVQMMRVLKPGGVLLAAASGFVPLVPDLPDYWRLSEEGWREKARTSLAGHDWQIEGHGNCLATVAAMLGLAQEELTPAELDVRDPRYPVLVTLFCMKRVSGQ